MANRPDAATISFTVNLPPEVIQTYFDGVAKVEKAKQKSRSLDLSGLAIFAPLVPMLVDLASPYLSEVSCSEPGPVQGQCAETGPCTFPVQGQCTWTEPCHNKGRDEKTAKPIVELRSESIPAVDEELPTGSLPSEPTHRPAYDEDKEVPTPQAATSSQMPDMANIMESMAPVMQQFASAFGMGVAAQPPKAHKHVPTKKTTKKPGVVKSPVKPKPKVKEHEVPNPEASQPEVPSPKVEAINARLEALIDSESTQEP